MQQILQLPALTTFYMKKRVAAGEVDKLGKELGNCTHQWTTNDDKNKRFRHLVFFRLKKKDRQEQKEERSREEDRREGGN